MLCVAILYYYDDGVVLRLVYCIAMWSVNSDRDEFIFLCVVCDIGIDIFESIIRCSSLYCIFFVEPVFCIDSYVDLPGLQSYYCSCKVS